AWPPTNSPTWTQPSARSSTRSSRSARPKAAPRRIFEGASDDEQPLPDRAAPKSSPCPVGCADHLSPVQRGKEDPDAAPPGPLLLPPPGGEVASRSDDGVGAATSQTRNHRKPGSLLPLP